MPQTTTNNQKPPPVIQEGSFTLIRGKQRAGKTLLMSILAKSALQSGRPIYTNIEYSFPHTPLYFKQLDLNDPETTEQIRNSTITLDELWMIIDSRSSQSQDSKRFSRWLYQVKKQGVDLIGTTHEVSLLDLRARENFDYLIDVQALPSKRPPNEPPKALHLIIQNGPLRTPLHKKSVLHLHPSFFTLYDTGNVFDPLAEPPGGAPKPKRHNSKEAGYLQSAPYKNLDKKFDF